MARALGMTGLLLALLVAGYLYRRQAETTGPEPMGARAAVDVAAVQRDLLQIANAERAYRALEGRYGTLDEMRNTGQAVPLNRRGPYVYSAWASDSSFEIVASYEGPPASGIPQRLVIDESMQIRKE